MSVILWNKDCRLTSFQQKREAFLGCAGSDSTSVLIFERYGCVGVCSWEVTLLLYAAIHCLQALCCV